MGFALYVLWVINVHPASSGPDMLLLLLKALISISAHSLLRDSQVEHSVLQQISL